MMLQVLTYGNQALRKKALRVECVDDEIRALAKAMIACMYAERGVGLAAEQVGRAVALCVLNVPAEAAGGVPMPLVLINPEITASEGEQDGQEGVTTCGVS